ncbi:hypothetical protein AB4Z48_21340 [Cupriavidus sp. 2TAF22]|uniref:hypothetical protein n=1 Tax=unclassified Cupriavidus TaxID=2640874 RepID=UPI003F9355CD
MRQGELLGRLVDGAVLRLSRDPWGNLLPSVSLTEPGPQGKAQFVHCWQIRKMMDSGLLMYDRGVAEESDRLLPTAGGLAAGQAWNRAKTRGEGQCG